MTPPIFEYSAPQDPLGAKLHVRQHSDGLYFIIRDRLEALSIRLDFQAIADLVTSVLMFIEPRLPAPSDVMADEPDDTVVVWNDRNNMWFGDSGEGFVSSLADAGQFTNRQLLKLLERELASTPPTDIPMMRIIATGHISHAKHMVPMETVTDVEIPE